MKVLVCLLALLPAMSACISSSNPPPKQTTVVVPADSKTTVICQDCANLRLSIGKPLAASDQGRKANVECRGTYALV